MSNEYWKYNEHTSYKHRILRYYLRIWSSKLGSVSEDLVFWDCFAGRGTYAEGQPGSPLLVLEESQKCWNGKRRTKLSCVFIEKEKKDFEKLRETLRTLYSDLENDRWFVYNSDYIDVYKRAMSGEISELHELTKKPTIFLLDPFGFKGMSLDIIKDMMSNSSCEVLITLMVENIKRHRNNSSVMDHFKKMFGADDLSRLDEICTKSKPEADIKEYYEERLTSLDGANIDYTLSFEMTPNRRDVVLYYLVFGTNHKAGLNVMHDTMRAISNNRDSFSFRGKKDGIDTLEYYIGDPQQEIADWILSLPLSIANLNTITFHAAQSKKPYSRTEMRLAIVKLVQEERLDFIPLDERAKERGGLGDRFFRFIQ